MGKLPTNLKLSTFKTGSWKSAFLEFTYTKIIYLYIRFHQNYQQNKIPLSNIHHKHWYTVLLIFTILYGYFLLFPIYRWRGWSSESHTLQVTELGLGTQALCFQPELEWAQPLILKVRKWFIHLCPALHSSCHRTGTWCRLNWNRHSNMKTMQYSNLLEISFICYSKVSQNKEEIIFFIYKTSLEMFPN